MILHSEYRSIIRPISRFIDKIRKKANDKNYLITVVVPEFIPKKAWQHLLHNQTSLRLKLHLIYQKKRYSVYYSIQINEITKGPNTLD